MVQNAPWHVGITQVKAGISYRGQIQAKDTVFSYSLSLSTNLSELDQKALSDGVATSQLLRSADFTVKVEGKQMELGRGDMHALLRLAIYSARDLHLKMPEPPAGAAALMAKLAGVPVENIRSTASMAQTLVSDQDDPEFSGLLRKIEAASS
jgi:hypothetical protein